METKFLKFYPRRILFRTSICAAAFSNPGDAIVILSGAILGPVWGYLQTSFYQLDDEARKEVVETIQFKLQYHRDPEGAEQIKQIKGW